MFGAITQQIDGAQLLVAVFFLFFAGLVYVLRREDKREGYPLEDVARRMPIEGFPPIPPLKVYRLLEGGTTAMPHREPPAPIRARPLLRFPAAPLVPIGDPMLARVGPGAYPLRKDTPVLFRGDEAQVVPLRSAADWRLAHGEADPRGMQVFDSRGVEVGTVRELWVDRAVKILRYLEVELAAGPSILLPIYYATINRSRRRIRVPALLAHQFAQIPTLASPEQITAREEDAVNAYFSGGLLYSRGREGGLPLIAATGAAVRS